MSFFKELVLGFRTYIDAHQFIKKHKLWGYVLLPGLINLVLFILTFWIGWHYTSQLTAWFFETIGLTPSNEEGGWLVSALNFILLFIMRLATVMVFLTLYKYIVLILMAPVMALLSEKTEELVTGQKFPFNTMRFLRDVLRGIFIALRNLFLELLLTALLLLLAFIPLVGLLSPFLIFAVQSYYYGFSMMDYYAERHKMSISESVRFMSKHRGLAIANGALFYWILIIPVVGLLVSPSHAIIAATLAVLKIPENEQG